jgi:hypothetical protein
VASRLAVAAVVLLVVVAGVDALRGRGGAEEPAPAQAPVSVVPAGGVTPSTPGIVLDPAEVPIGNDLKGATCEPPEEERGGWTSYVCIREVRPAP